MAPIIIDNQVQLKALLAHITKKVGEDENQLIFVDLEGVNLSRSGMVAIMQLLMPPDPIVYLVDVHVLGMGAFKITTEDDTSLKSILESKTMFKVFFDVRNDSDALYAHFGVNLAGVIDLQVMEYATRQPRGRFVNGLAKCIEQDLPYTPGWSLVKANGRRLFAPEAGGTYEVFLERPMTADIVKYCEQDVMLMPQLLALYGPKLRPGVSAQIQTIVDDRIRLSKTVTFNGKGQHMAVGPYLAKTRSHANTPTSPEVNLVRSAELRQLCRLDDSLLDDLTRQFETLQVEQEPPITLGSNTTESNHTATANKQDSGSTDPSSVVPLAIPSTNSPDDDEEDESDRSSEDERLIRLTGNNDFDLHGDGNQDFTACSADDCGYCGNCGY